MKKHLLPLLLAALFPPLPSPAVAQGVTVAASPEGLRQLEAVQRYLQGLKTFSARFRQQAAGEPVQTGTFALSRPGKMRLEYGPPQRLLMVADGQRFVVFDPSLGQPAYSRLSEQPFAFLLQPQVNLRDPKLNITVRQDGERLQLDTRPSPDLPPMTFVFATNPLQLEAWHYADEQGRPVTVTLDDVQENKPLASRLFRFSDPNLERYQQK